MTPTHQKKQSDTTVSSGGKNAPFFSASNTKSSRSPVKVAETAVPAASTVADKAATNAGRAPVSSIKLATVVADPVRIINNRISRSQNDAPGHADSPSQGIVHTNTTPETAANSKSNAGGVSGSGIASAIKKDAASVPRSSESPLVPGLAVQPSVEAEVAHTHPATPTHEQASATEHTVKETGSSTPSPAASPAKAEHGDKGDTPASKAEEPAGTVPAGTGGFRHIRPEATAAVFAAKLRKAGNLAHQVATTKTAAVKLAESEKAQDTPPSESQSLANEGQVASVYDQKPDLKTEDNSRSALETGINNAVPSSLGDMDDFKDNGKGQEISKVVMKQVSGDVADVKSGFVSIGATPKAPESPKGKPLPAPEEAEPVAPINMGSGVIPAIDKKELDTKQYLDQSDNILKTEEISQEHLDMVDSGDLANANKQRKSLQKEAMAQPAVVREMAAHEHGKLDASMKAEETHARTEMHQHRKTHLSTTGARQLQAKIDLEKKRDEVAKTINQRYEACQKSILGKLDELEKNSLAQFDRGQAQATTDFESQVDADISKFKKKRYDRFGGSLLWAKDKIFGIDDFPEVTQAFDKARKNFSDAIDRLIGTITAASNKVINECKKELEDTKAGIAIYVASLGPQLQDVGKKAQEEINNKLTELSAEIDKRKDALKKKLADKRKAAMEAIDKKIEAMKASMRPNE